MCDIECKCKCKCRCDELLFLIESFVDGFRFALVLFFVFGLFFLFLNYA